MARSHERIEAAGAVVLRGREGAHEVLAVHRPRHDDWSLPKGRLEAGELLPACAVREVSEETGAAVRLDLPLGTTSYQVGGRPKRVHYWRARVAAMVGHVPDDEVDEVAWLPVAGAADRLTHRDEAALVARAVAAGPTVPLLITRHGKAMERKRWAHRDAARPLADRGRRQAREVTKVLAAFGVDRIASSTSNRCVATVLPYATQRRSPIERASILSEERGADDARGVGECVRELARAAVDTQLPTVVCGHRPVLPAMLAGLDLAYAPFRTGETMVVNLRPDCTVAAVERIRTIA